MAKNALGSYLEWFAWISHAKTDHISQMSFSKKVELLISVSCWKNLVKNSCSRFASCRNIKFSKVKSQKVWDCQQSKQSCSKLKYLELHIITWRFIFWRIFWNMPNESMKICWLGAINLPTTSENKDDALSL